MQPTPRTGAWSAWAGWAPAPRDLVERRRLRLTVTGNLRELPQLRRDWQRLPHQLAVYTPDQLRQLLRLESALGRWSPTAPPDRWRLERRPDLEPHWRMPDFIHNLEQVPSSRGVSGVSGGEGGAGTPSRGWEGAARGWAAGAVLLAVLLLLVRALERCLHRRLFKGRRRPSEEWPTPNVLATSHRFNDGSVPGLDDSDTFTSEARECASNDLPPPYSECAPNELADPKTPGPEDPPPPYSACYFNNPKDGVPTVHFYRRDEAHTSGEPSISGRDADKIEGCDSDENQRDVGNNVRENQECVIRRDGDDHVVHMDAGAQERVLAV